MKQFDSRTYSVNDFVEWDAANQLELNPKFQRRPVWTEKAKSFLIDTIVRGKPMPKVFIRQKINPLTKTSLREVVDGQQRLKTILSFVKDGFAIMKQQNKDIGGLRFSELGEDIQTKFLSYEIAVDLLINLPDPEILDIFSRLNSYAVLLNEQEKINADHFSQFKVLADRIGHKYYDFWINQNILTSKSIMRMQEVNLTADLLISMIEGIKSKKQIKKYYDQYEKTFDLDIDDLEEKFDRIIQKTLEIYPEGIAETEFRRLHLFYSLFNAINHCLYGVKNLTDSRYSLTNQSLEHARFKWEGIDIIFNTDDLQQLDSGQRQFLEDSRRATTDENIRVRRAKYLLGLLS